MAAGYNGVPKASHIKDKLIEMTHRTESLHGAGSPQAQRMMIARQGNVEQKKLLAKRLSA